MLNRNILHKFVYKNIKLIHLYLSDLEDGQRDRRRSDREIDDG